MLVCVVSVSVLVCVVSVCVSVCMFVGVHYKVVGQKVLHFSMQLLICWSTVDH